MSAKKFGVVMDEQESHEIAGLSFFVVVDVIK